MKAVCPKCGNIFEAQRHKKGAAYALKWDKLPKRCMQLLAWWLSSQYASASLTKDQVGRSFGRPVAGGIAARVSELYALDLVKQEVLSEPPKFPNILWNDFEGSYPAVVYSLNKEKAIAVLNAGGRLKEKIQA